MKTDIEIPFGANDSDLKGWEYTIPEGMEAIVKDGKVIVKEKESEDERIRKWIIEEFKIHYDFESPNLNPMVEKALAYLEKQKEQKLNWMKEDYSGMDDVERIIHRGFLAAGVRNVPRVIIEDTAKEVRNIFKKEQKPNIEICPHSIKSKSYLETGYPIEDCDYGLEIAYDILEKTFGEIRGYQTDDGIREHQIAIEAVRKANEQNSAEKQDYSGLDDLERAVLRGFLAAGVENVPVEIIKETAKECLAQMKPAEWGEEDEKMRQDLIAYFVGEDVIHNPGLKCYEVAEWLKSLRPSWKPSEEQMEALERTTRLANFGLEKNRRKALVSLYEQLKKL